VVSPLSPTPFLIGTKTSALFRFVHEFLQVPGGWWRKDRGSFLSFDGPLAVHIPFFQIPRNRSLMRKSVLMLSLPAFVYSPPSTDSPFYLSRSDFVIFCRGPIPPFSEHIASRCSPFSVYTFLFFLNALFPFFFGRGFSVVAMIRLNSFHRQGVRLSRFSCERQIGFFSSFLYLFFSFFFETSRQFCSFFLSALEYSYYQRFNSPSFLLWLPLGSRSTLYASVARVFLALV